MKFKIAIITLVALIGILGMSMTTEKTSKIEVPQAVKNAFNQKYPAAKKVEWELEKVGEYEAEFKMNREEMSANFLEDGTWVGSETELDKDDLPQAVKKGIAAKFPGHEIEEAELSEKPNGIITYEVELENEKEDAEFKAVFAADGNFIKKEMNNEDEDDGEDEEDDEHDDKKN